ncbi:sperm microtubule associated protein 2 isoform X2 [Vulpes vulpes]|uniref:Sperm microtubule associated protein 2 isoform X2 n=1 Tax=Vulpes vulpes TaxID=9627 RepID=A0A3Q7UP58_VULVU|nr:testicular haploid expressed gene protein isoform X2 [Vulpes vulpes]
MGDRRRHSSLRSRQDAEAEGRPDRGQHEGVLGMRGPGPGGQGPQDPRYADDGDLRSEEQDEEVLPEVMGEDIVPSPRSPEAALMTLQGVLEKDTEDGIPELSRLSIAQGVPSASRARGRKRRRGVFELAKPKTNWQVLKDRPSVYWTERFLEDTTLTITVPEVSRRVEELARPKRFYSEYYNNSRSTPIWPIPRSSLEYQASSRLRDLAIPRVRNNIWSINMSEVSQVSRAAQLAIPSPRILRLAKPRAPAPLLKEWDPMPKPKPHVSDYNRLLHLAMPKAQSDQCVPDRDPRWEVLDVTKKAVASPRIISLAKPKVRKDLNEGYDRPPLACTSSPSPRASPKECERPRPGL